MSRAARRALVLTVLPATLLAFAGVASAADEEGGGGGPGGPTPTIKTVTHTLSVSKSHNGGTVTSSPAGINCGSDCEHQDSQDVECIGLICDEGDPDAWDTVQLTATPPTGYGAPSWTGCASSSGATCTVKVDANRNVGVSWRDTQAPFVLMDQPLDGATVGATLFVLLDAGDNSGGPVTRELLIDGVPRTYPGSGAVDMSTVSGWTHGTTHTVQGRATDQSGNQALTAQVTVTVDRQLALSVSTPPAFTDGATVPVTISTDSDATMWCGANGEAKLSCDGPTWSGVTAGSPDGSYTYEVWAQDGTGNAKVVTRTFTLDRTDPVVSDFDGPSEGAILGIDRATFTFAASDANLQSVRCKVGSAAPAPCSSATSHELTGLPDGPVVFSLIVTDKAGNQVTRTRSFFIQRIRQTTGGTTTTTTAGGSGGSSTPAGGGAGSAPSQTAPVAGSLKTLPAKLAYRRQRRGGRTRLTGLRLTRVPRGATVTMTCKGQAKKGCPRKPLKSVRRSGTVKLGALAKLRLRKGAVIAVTVTAPGYAPKTMTVRI